MIRQERLDKLKEYDDPQQFYGALLCELNIVKQHREVFKEKARDFNKKCLEYEEAKEKAIDRTAVDKAIKRKEKAIAGFIPPCLTTLNKPPAGCSFGDLGCLPKVHCTTPYKPPKGGWKRIEKQIQKDGLSFSWASWVSPVFPDDPVYWFNIYKPSHYDVSGELLDMKTVCRPEDELLRDYVALAVLFNKQAKERVEIPISPESLQGIEIPLESAIRQIWLKVRVAFINTLEAVNKDLAEKEKQLTQGLNDKQAASGLEKNEVKLQPLTPKALVIYEKLCSLKTYDAMTLPKIQNWFFSEYQKNIKLPKNLDEGTWKDIRKELLPYGLMNKPKVGYYIIQNNI
ncbi:MAG: hypothetical protein MUO27_08245 [Sedimentisphaerales bacterium]|nr:hypothetical protein [Sedimentisphaerales bacterium]